SRGADALKSRGFVPPPATPVRGPLTCRDSAMWMRRWWVWTGVSLSVALVTAGLWFVYGGEGTDAGPRPLTGAEAERLALARFRTYRGSPSEVVVRASVPGGGEAVVRAVVDQRRHRGVGWYEVGGDRGQRGLVAWDAGGLAVARTPVDSLAAAVRQAGQPSTRWARRPFGEAPLDSALRLTTLMATDRPENAQLLAQSGPLRLRGEEIGGRHYDVFSGPRPRPRPQAGSAEGRSPLTYWIGADGGLRRITADLGAGRRVSVDVVGERGRVGVPGAPWEGGRQGAPSGRALAP
ncbi:hypothetical protein ABZ896_06605, partial [Streptomyces sp. NPDC047072]|uniref:hypothetical protein n=1 Tax=Streptomyces sp. NPDC047072 TaxID=3154809 RepID=UPI003400B377